MPATPSEPRGLFQTVGPEEAAPEKVPLDEVSSYRCPGHFLAPCPAHGRLELEEDQDSASIIR